MHRSSVFLIQLTLILIAISSMSGKLNAKERHIYLISTGWHIGIVVPVDNVLKRNLPESLSFPNADFLEISWGEKTFYQASNPSFAMAFNALLTSSPSVIHIFGFSNSVNLAFEKAEIIKISLKEGNYSNLLSFIHKSFTRNANGSSRPEGPGLYGTENSRFYTSNGKFHLLNTCNTWAANAITKAGVEIDFQNVITAEGLMSEVRNYVQNK
jgi:uncharacterized protein (TIGR02117 family)